MNWQSLAILALVGLALGFAFGWWLRRQALPAAGSKEGDASVPLTQRMSRWARGKAIDLVLGRRDKGKDK